MRNNKTTIKLPEISAKSYAEINGLSRERVNKMCSLGSLPCRKIGENPEGEKDTRPWWVNIAKLEEQIK